MKNNGMFCQNCFSYILGSEKKIFLYCNTCADTGFLPIPIVEVLGFQYYKGRRKINISID